MGIINSIKNFRWGYLLISIIFCAAGACFVIFPHESLNIVSYIIAVTAIIAGILQLIKILAHKKRGVPFAFSVISATLTIICGAVAAIIPEQVIKIYPMFIGLLIIIDGAFKLQTVINAKRYNLKMWWFLLIIASFTIIGGFLVVRLRFPEQEPMPFTLVLGISIFLCGFENLLSLFYLGKIVKRATFEYDAHAIEINDSAVIADSYINTDPTKIKEEFLPPITNANTKKRFGFFHKNNSEKLKNNNSDISYGAKTEDKEILYDIKNEISDEFQDEKKMSLNEHADSHEDTDLKETSDIKEDILHSDKNNEDSANDTYK